MLEEGLSMNIMTSYFKIEEEKSQIISYTAARLIKVLNPENPPAQSRIDYVVQVTCTSSITTISALAPADTVAHVFSGIPFPDSLYY
jgi:hypothetical protein